jgi:hypothetical protein
MAERQTDELNQGNLHQPKDKFARKMLSQRDLAIPFFEAFLPSLNPEKDWSGLQEEPGSFVSEEYASAYSDVLFSLRRDSKQTLVYMLIEHKSQQDHWTLLYLLRIMTEIWLKWLDQNGRGQKSLPAIIPIILHQSADAWTAPVRFAEYFKNPELLAHVPQFQAQLVDLAALEMSALQDWFLETILSLMKAVVEGTALEWLEDHQEQLSVILQGRGRDFLGFLTKYLAQSKGRINTSTIKTIASKIPNIQLKKEIMTWGESLKEEGREEGRETGREEGERIGRIAGYREFLGLDPIPRAELLQLSLPELDGMLKALMQQAKERLGRN